MKQNSEMSKVISFKKWQVLCLLVSIFILIYLVSSFLRPNHKTLSTITGRGTHQYTKWPELSLTADSEVSIQ